MTLQQQVRAALAPVVAGEAYYGQNTRQPPVYPYATFLFIINSNNITFDGPSDVQSTRIQVDVFSRDPGQARSIARSVKDAFVAGFVVGAIDEQDFPPDPDTKAFRASADYTVWSAD